MYCMQISLALVLAVVASSKAMWVSAPEATEQQSLTDVGFGGVKMGVVACSLLTSASPSASDITNPCGEGQVNEMCKFDTMFCKCKQRKSDNQPYWTWKCPHQYPPP